ncbi:hypothetical protein [Shewanella chilikensis]|uniref:hypothetical protein n=1 Tax=Shewanella chilikensis TaxID=558541 RepID=UPI001CD47666|nr:hypothetical protein [Shewanella chilikensis]MCA0951419.1 hypothetical protein [Shewanella chilikensis]
MQNVHSQQEFELTSAVHSTPNGIEMGVLTDGTPYLSARGLADLCGVAPSVIITLTSRWQEQRDKPRGKMIERMVVQQGADPNNLYRKVKFQNTPVHAISDKHCMAILEYYAFEAQTSSERARQNYRELARYSLREYIYQSTGYNPNLHLPPSWAVFHERMTLNRVPPEYFSVFQEMSSLTVDAIRNGMPFDKGTVPDGSVGIAWSKHWDAQGLNIKFGARTKHPHKFPDDWPQRDCEAWIYPIAALGVFRQWMNEVYLPEKFPSYIKGKIVKGDIAEKAGYGLIAAVVPAQIQHKK